MRVPRVCHSSHGSIARCTRTHGPAPPAKTCASGALRGHWSRRAPVGPGAPELRSRCRALLAAVEAMFVARKRAFSVVLKTRTKSGGAAAGFFLVFFLRAQASSACAQPRLSYHNAQRRFSYRLRRGVGHVIL